MAKWGNGGLARFAAGGTVAGKGRRMAQRAMSQFLEGITPAVAPEGAHSVVKPKGGNWLTGSVEDALKGLKRPTASVEGLLRIVPEADEALLRQVMPNAVRDAQIPGNQAINRWIEGPLTKYVKTRMASPEDEVRKLAEQGVLHFDPDWVPEASVARGEMAAKDIANVGRLGKTRLAHDWEDLSDLSVIGAKYKDHAELDTIVNPAWPNAEDIRREALHRIGGKYATENPDMLAYRWSGSIRNDALGFPHLIDELSNALNPASGLPRNLQLSPESMANLSMEKAVRRVAEINAWRAAQKAEANRKLAEQAMTVREYAENNPKGLKWVELKAPDKVSEVDINEAFRRGESDYSTAAKRKVLAEQLKYEGDTMGHCVGGYCDDVLSGRSRIFSLRDTKGEPHVTIEVQPSALSEKWSGAEDIIQMDYPETYKAWMADTSPETASLDIESWIRLKQPDHPIIKQPPKITQIKGKQNRAPNPEYLPFVQDFVRNSPLGGPWADVGDIGNTGLRRTRDVFNQTELQTLRDMGADLDGDGFITPEEADQYQKMFGSGASAKERMSYDSHIDDLDVDLPAQAAPIRRADGGTVSYNWDIFDEAA